EVDALALRDVAEREVVQLLRLEEAEDLEPLVDAAGLHEPVGDGAVDGDLALDEPAVERAVLSDEAPAQALDLGDRLLAEEDRERALVPRVEEAREAVVRAVQGIGRAERGRRSERAHGERLGRGRVA